MRVAKKIQTKVDSKMVRFKNKANALLTKKEKGVNGLVVEVGLVIVGVVLLALFNKQIGAFFTSIISQVTTKAEAILNLSNGYM